MNGDVLKKQSRVLMAVSVMLVLAACSATKPAPVVNRTTPNRGATAPEQPKAPPTQAAGAGTGAAGQGAQGQPASPPPEAPAQVTPIYQGAIQPGGGNSSPQDPNLKVGPQGIKRAYGKPAPAVVTTPKNPRPQQQPVPGAVAGAAAAGSAATGAAAGAGAAAPKDPVVATGGVIKSPSASAPGETRTFDGVRFSWPVPGRVVQKFDGDSNKGMLLSGNLGDPVLAAADGRVIYSGAGPRGFGNLVILKHSNEMLTVYAHHRSLSVKEGQQVKRGQKVGEVGESANNRPGVYFEVRQGSKPVDPAGVLPPRS